MGLLRFICKYRLTTFRKMNDMSISCASQCVNRFYIENNFFFDLTTLNLSNSDNYQYTKNYGIQVITTNDTMTMNDI